MACSASSSVVTVSILHPRQSADGPGMCMHAAIGLSANPAGVRARGARSEIGVAAAKLGSCTNHSAYGARAVSHKSYLHKGARLGDESARQLAAPYAKSTSASSPAQCLVNLSIGLLGASSRRDVRSTAAIRSIRRRAAARLSLRGGGRSSDLRHRDLAIRRVGWGGWSLVC